MGVLSCFCLLVKGSAAQTLRYPQVAPYIGLGAYSYQFVDVLSCTANQAALARLSRAGAGIYAERRYGLEALNSFSAMVALPSSLGGWGLAAHYLGSGEYNESQVGIAYGKKLGRVDLGVQFNYAMMRAAGYGSDGAIVVEVGTLWHITDRVHAGVHVFNPAGGKYGKQQSEKMAWVYKVGGGYEVSGQLLISADIIKQEDKPVVVQAGIQFVPDKRLFIRAGITTGSTTPWLGAGWAWNNIRADITGSYHPQLGLTPGLLLLFHINKKKAE